jgi:hypothetical protein
MGGYDDARGRTHYPNISELDIGSGLNEDSAEKPKECFDKAQHERKNFQ